LDAPPYRNPIGETVKAFLKNTLALSALAFGSLAMAQAPSYDRDGRYAPSPMTARITFYENESFGGRNFSTQEQVDDFRRSGFNDRSSSLVVVGDRWEVCEDIAFSGRCVVLRAGNYPTLASIGLNDRISSVRYVNWNARNDSNRDERRDFRRRSGERTYEADVTSVRAVVANAEQRCWMEREQVAPQRSGASVPGAVVGAVLGGILGHQIGNGSGQDIATVGGAVAGGFVGANVGRGSAQQAQFQEVQRCTSVQSQTPTYWDVTYNFRGQEHRVQMTTQPGATVTVNEQGEPRA
jgi:uncharacterized protein YcfJ